MHVTKLHTVLTLHYTMLHCITPCYTHILHNTWSGVAQWISHNVGKSKPDTHTRQRNWFMITFCWVAIEIQSIWSQTLNSVTATPTSPHTATPTMTLPHTAWSCLQVLLWRCWSLPLSWGASYQCHSHTCLHGNLHSITPWYTLSWGASYINAQEGLDMITRSELWYG